jgi:hypothetical protein
MCANRTHSTCTQYVKHMSHIVGVAAYFMCANRMSSIGAHVKHMCPHSECGSIFHCNAAPVERVLLAHHIFLKPQSNILFSHGHQTNTIVHNWTMVYSRKLSLSYLNITLYILIISSLVKITLFFLTILYLF